MFKKQFFGLFILFSVATFGQEGTASPYSFFGIGDVKFKGGIENRSMGTVSGISDSIHLNLQNPALYTNLKLTTFTISGTYNNTTLKTNTQNEKSQRSALDYLAIGIPLKKATIAFGVLPYSSVGYRMENTTTNPIYSLQYRGRGGVNKVFIGAAHKISEKFSFGADVQYNFGQIETTLVTTIKANPFLPTREINTSRANGLNFNTGLSYQSKFKKKYTVFASTIFSPSADLKLKNTRELATISINSSGVESVIDAASEIKVPNTTIKLPTKFAISAGIGESRKWAVATEVTFANNDQFTNRFSDINAQYTNATKVAFGGYYVPKYNAYNSFLKKIVYRGGFRMEKTGLIINSKEITDTAVSLGFGLPMRGSFSNINLGLEYGSRGTASNGLVRENYFNFSFAFSFNDQWFRRSKFD